MSLEAGSGSYEHGVVLRLAEEDTLGILEERIADARFYAQEIFFSHTVVAQGPKIGDYSEVSLAITEELIANEKTNRAVCLSWPIEGKDGPEKPHQILLEGHYEVGELGRWGWHVSEGFPTNQANNLLNRLNIDKDIEKTHSTAAGFLIDAVILSDGEQKQAIEAKDLIDGEENPWFDMMQEVADKSVRSRMDYEISLEIYGEPYNITAIDGVFGQTGHYSTDVPPSRTITLETPGFTYSSHQEENGNIIHYFQPKELMEELEHEAIGELSERQAREVIEALELIIAQRAQDLKFPAI